MIGRVNSPALFSPNGPAGGSNTVSSFHQAVAHAPYDAVRQDILSRPLSPSLSLTHTSASDTMFSRLTDSTGGFGNRMDDFTGTWTSVSDTMTSSSSNWSSDIPDNEVDDVAEAEPEPPDVVQSYQFRGVYFDSVRTIVRPNPRFAANANIYPAMGMAESSVSLATAIDWAETAVPSGVTSMSGSSTPERPLTPPTAMDAVEAARCVAEQIAVRQHFEEDVEFRDHEWLLEQAGCGRVEIWVTEEHSMEYPDRPKVFSLPSSPRH